jgi:hypothetical protein
MPSAKTVKKTVRSKRVAWPEPGREGGGEFRLTVGRITAILGILAGIPALWTIGGHYMNKDEIEKAIAENRTTTEKEIKDHITHDVSVQAWNQYLFSANRLEYLDDKQAECDAKRLAHPQLDPADAAICARYEAKYKSKTQEAADLKSEAMKTTKEK